MRVRRGQAIQNPFPCIYFCYKKCSSDTWISTLTVFPAIIIWFINFGYQIMNSVSQLYRFELKYLFKTSTYIYLSFFYITCYIYITYLQVHCTCFQNNTFSNFCDFNMCMCDVNCYFLEWIMFDLHFYERSISSRCY